MKNKQSIKSSASYNQVKSLRNTWVSLLNRYNWDWFATLTFNGLPTTYTAHNRVNRWLRIIEKDIKKKVGYYRVMEFTRLGVPHFHLLMGNLDGVRRDKYWKIWFRENGRARILPYNSKLGASYYLTKYVIKDEYANVENWEISGLECLNQLNFKHLTFGKL